MSSDEKVCMESVADAGGYRFHPCGKPAKWVAIPAKGKIRKLRCGIHIRKFRKFWSDHTVEPLLEDLK